MRLETSGIERIWVDCDEVFCDFIGGALAIHGLTRADLGVPGYWGIAEPLGMTEDQLFDPIKRAGQPFWFNLAPTPWTEQLVHLLNSLPVPWSIATSLPLDCPGSYEGRKEWLVHFCRLYDLPHDFAIIPNKAILANNTTMLIDDKEENVNEFVSCGGDGLVFPSIVNYLYKFADDPVSYLKSMLEDYRAFQFSKRK